MCHRRLSSQEAAYRLSNLNLIHTSRKYIFVNTMLPEKRFRLLRRKKELDNLPDDSEDIFHNNMLDYYGCRPESLLKTSYYQFCAWYEKSSAPTDKSRLERFNIEKYDIWILKNTKAIIVRVPNFPVNIDEYFYAMLLLLLPHRSEKDICQPFDSYKEAFMHKHKDFDTSINHTYFSFSKQVENSMRRMRVLEQGVENDCFSNYNESVDFLTLKHEILEQSFQFLSEGVVNVSCSNEKNCTNNENHLQYDGLHTHSMYCSMSIMEFKNNLEKLTNSQLNVIMLKKHMKTNNCHFIFLLQEGQVLGKCSQQRF